jgi:histidine triad (HIT) family protein
MSTLYTLPDCLFCKIASGSIPVTKLYEDDNVLAFPDINPQAPTHILLIPKQHFQSLAQTTTDNSVLLGHLLAAANQIAQQQGLANGYRTVINTGDDGGQTVGHLHLHILGGRHMGWPPG